MAYNNPFTLDFGAKPNLYVSRNEERNKILNTFLAEMPSTHIFILMGARGTGKTVLMTEVAHDIRDHKGWHHVDLGTDGDMLNALAGYLYKKYQMLDPKIKLDVSLKGIGISVEKGSKYSDIHADLDEIINGFKKKGIKILVTVDEVSNSPSVRAFMSYFQHCIREEMDIFVIGTGLYKNVRALQNNKTMTFLKRAPKIMIGALNLMRISRYYQEVFDIDYDKASVLARLTDGYSYAFQTLGYILCDKGKKEADEDVLTEYMVNLSECSYDKIWEELSGEERRVVMAVADSEPVTAVNEIRNKLEMDSNSFSTYKDTLIKSGILSDRSSRGYVSFSLPFFREFVIQQYTE